MSRGRRITVDADRLSSEIRDGSIRVVDVRKAADYNKGHLPSAVNLPLSELLLDDSPERMGKLFGSMGIGDEMPVAVYDDTFGALASRVAWALEYIGHGDVSLLDVTYSGWTGIGLDTEQAAPEVRSAKHAVDPRDSILATLEQTEKAVEDGAVLIDNRERLNYLEQHIPGSVNIPYRTLGSPDKIIRPSGELTRLLDNRDIPHGKEAITYCGSVGTLSGLAYYALKSAGMEDVRLYVRSFKEWKALSKPTSKQEEANYWDLSAE
ncbi:rhodanese-related sulfurtransferase [Cenarchaeum symbiosum A]|uniref:Rhodanese-related sulfurtransferase n=1 Tax=Cenarchaeum symbiosum (strain A) TaxID=414004 RepID=A0RUH8_CENSY|nr:rhodanese-related sulfurtransferase [Cenarchaeum symbiosum A]